MDNSLIIKRKFEEGSCLVLNFQILLFLLSVNHALKISFEMKCFYTLFIAFCEVTGLVTGYLDAMFNAIHIHSQDCEKVTSINIYPE